MLGDDSDAGYDPGYGDVIDVARLKKAVEYANALLNRGVSLERGEKAITSNFTAGMAQSWVWGAAVRAHYDASALRVPVPEELRSKTSRRAHTCDLPGCASCGNPEDATTDCHLCGSEVAIGERYEEGDPVLCQECSQ